MTRFVTLFAACMAAITAQAAPLFFSATAANRVPGVQPALQPTQYRTLGVADASLKAFLFALQASPEAAVELDLPTPDGGTRTFRVWQNDVMHPDLAAKYPEIKTFTATALDNPACVARLDYSPRGFRAMVLDGASTFFIDPYGPGGEGHAIAYYKRDYSRPAAERMGCKVVDEAETMEEAQRSGGLTAAMKVYGTTRKTYRLAVACTGEYSVAVAGANPTKVAVLAAIVTSVNRVSGVYEKEIAVTLQLIGNNDTLINLDGTTDPYSNGNGSAMLAQNQTAVDARVGTAAYDIGHVFSTGGGGVAQAGVCSSTLKARGVTGQNSPVGDPFDIDYVAHEMGHQFTASHTFNAATGSCSGNGVSSSAYEPGSGATIMAYAGICGSGDNLQSNSDPYFHARSLDQITTNLNTGTASGCGVSTATGNDIPVVAPFTFQDTLYIPLVTHFELTAPAVTNTLSSAPLTYCWEQYDLGQFRASVGTASVRPPIFRSLPPDTAGTRVFPRISRTVRNVTSYLGERLPDSARTMRFTLTVRDVYNGYGAFSWGEDTIRMRAVNTGAPFRVTSQGTALPAPLLGASTQTVTWDTAGTQAAPISAATVDIFYSLDSGYTYPYTLAAGVPNNGSAQVVLPNVATTAGRFKVKPVGNVFFDLNDRPFAVDFDPIAAGVGRAPWADAVTVYPVPASETVFVQVPAGKILTAGVMNAVGQTVWQGSLEGAASIPVGRWAKGVYTLQLLDTRAGEKAVKRLVVE